MTRNYRLTRRAEFDLAEIWGFIAGDNRDAAHRLIKRLYRIFAMLARQPGIGEIRDDLGRELRSFPTKNYVIYYRPSEGSPSVEILRVVHGARNIDTIFGTTQGDEVAPEEPTN